MLAGMLIQSALAAGPSISKRGIVFSLKTHYHKAEWTWTPSVRFRIGGPLTSSSVISISYTLPSGKPFVTVRCENTYAIPEKGGIVVNDCGFRQEDSAAINQTGVFGFQIKQSDELAG